MIPKHVSRYEVLERLGQGTIGQVFRAYDPDLSRDVAIKFISLPDIERNNAHWQRFRREVQAVAQLKHAHIITIYDVGFGDQIASEKVAAGQINLTKLRQLLASHFSISELRNLCFDLDIKYDSLPGDNLGDKAREFVSHLERCGRTVELIKLCRIRWPKIEWQDIVPSLEPCPPYVVMELLTGGTLADRLEPDSLPWQEALKLFLPLCQALAHAHQAGVIHRDVKPTNIMFASDEANTLKLVDFGLARWEGSGYASQVGNFLGTPAYMSPEQAQGQTVDGRTDIYALGVILFQMVTGRLPFEADAPMAMIVQHIKEPIPLPSLINPDIPAQVEAVILKAMEKIPDKRYQSAGGMIEALFSIGLNTDTPSFAKTEAADVSSCATSEIRIGIESPQSASIKNWDRLKCYLPAELYREVELAPRDKREALCVDHLKQLLQIVVTYVPRHLALSLLQEPVPPKKQTKGQFLEGTLLFADISGFTPLSERLREIGGKEGAEEIVRIVNEYLDVMLGILFKYNGRLIKFGGDAMLCLFTGENHGAMNAIRAAWEMRREMGECFTQVKALQEIFPLDMKVGQNSGLLFAATTGTAEHMEYILTGSAVEHTAHAESFAQRGEVLVSEGTYKWIQTDTEAEALPDRPGFYRITAVNPEPPSTLANPWLKVSAWLSKLEQDVWGMAARLDALTPYLPTGVLPQLIYAPHQAHLTGEHRQVTVLFANFIGMSDVINAHGVDNPEGIAADLNEYFQAMQEEVQYYGGAINKVDLYDQGDKLMVIFGAPIAHERDARRAALAALAMQQAITRLSSPAAAALLSQRIGIHTGFVFAGNVGSTEHHRREYTVMGNTVNLAARLMSASRSGEIWISQQVWSQIQRDFEAATLPPAKMKGISQPVPVYRLQSAINPQSQQQPLRAFHSDIVGRESELETLAWYVEDLLAGSGKQIAAITGEGGVGKTRLIAEWHRQIDAVLDLTESVTWIVGYGRSYGQQTHGVFIEVLEQLLGIEEEDAQDEKWQKLSTRLRESFADAATGWLNAFSNKLAYLGQFLSLDLSRRRGLEEAVSQLDAEGLQLQTRLAICDLLEYTAEERPLLLILEDLHWADKASLDMLEFAVDRVTDDSPILFCLAFRPQKEQPIWRTWQALERSYPDCHLMALPELRGAGGQQLLANLLQTDHLPPDFQQLILHETDGNPLYIEEVLHTLIEDGVLVEGDGGWEFARSIARVKVPDTLYQIIQSRIDDLDFSSSPGARRVLWLAAIIGAEFTEEILLHLFQSTGREKGECLRHLRALRNADMLQRTRIKTGGQMRPGYQFRHGLVQQVAYENMMVSKRRQYHQQVGCWLEEKHAGELPRYYDTLAYHYDRAGQWDKAFAYHWQAGDKDAGTYANEGAIFHLQRALHIASDAAAKGDELAQVHFTLGRVLATIGRLDDALVRLQAAYELFDAVNEKSALQKARICYEIGRIYERRTGGLGAALAWCDKGLALLPEAPTAEAARLHALGGLASLRQGKFQRAEQKARRSLALAQVINARSELSVAHRMLSITSHVQGDLEEAMIHCQRSIAICEKLPDLIGLSKDYKNQGVFAFEMDDWILAEESYQKAMAVQERVGDKLELTKIWINLGDLYSHLGDIEQGFAFTQRALDAAVEMDAFQEMLVARVIQAVLYWRQGELEQALVELFEADKLAESVTMFKPTVGRWLSQVYLTQGDAAAAEGQLQHLFALDMDVLADEVEPIQRLWGQTLIAQGKLAEGVQTLEASLERLKEAQMRYQTGLTRLALAEALARMDDQEVESRDHAIRARTIFRELGAKLDEQEVNQLIT